MFNQLEKRNTIFLSSIKTKVAIKFLKKLRPPPPTRENWLVAERVNEMFPQEIVVRNNFLSPCHEL